MTQLLHNIDDVRDRIVQLESAEVFDEDAWLAVLADLRSAGRVAGLADAQRRMETARENQPSPKAGEGVSVAVETGFKYGMKLLFTNDNMSEMRFQLQNGQKIWYSEMNAIQRGHANKLIHSNETEGV